MSKAIVITGAGRGLGRALAERFCRDGDTVVLIGRTASNLSEVAAALGDRTIPVQCDVASASSVRNAFSEIQSRLGKFDVLINNAALYEPSYLADASDEHIVDSIMTNLVGPMLCSRSAIPLLPFGGHIINITSESLEIPYPMLSVYQSSKAGLEQLSRSLHRELAASGIRVTTVRAGAMRAPDGWQVDPAIGARFATAAREQGLDIMRCASSDVNSVTNVFRSLIDLPADVTVAQVNIHARYPA